jgi:pimeloyl-ACP methyl ester carboxylesterase
MDVPLAGDRPLRLAHAPADLHHAVIYLHGMCGDPEGADPWIDLATQYATVITVRANIKCPDRPGYKWPQDPEEIQPRIDAALEHVRALRNGHLDMNEVTLIGYSQGSHRAEKLASAFPGRYRDLVLGGPPTAADPALLRGARAVAVLGGELEDATHMMQGTAALQAAGIRTRFFLLPGAHHGTYGPEGRRVMTDVLMWIWPPQP